MMCRKIKSCFDTAPVNTGRQRELDIAKGLVIFFMAISHGIEIMNWFFDPQNEGDFFWYGFDMLIKGTAPVFIFCMGISLCYSKKQSAKAIFLRALDMAGTVVLLELVRSVLPCLLEWLIFRDLSVIVYAQMIVCMDILQFATVALLTIALFKVLRLKTGWMLAIAAVCSVIGQLLQEISTGSWLGDRLAGVFWKSYDIAYFPLFNWLIVLVIGYAFGKLWLRLRDKDTFFAYVTPICTLISVAYYASMVLRGQWYYLSGGNYCGIGILDVAFLSVVFLAVVGICHYVGKWLPGLARMLASMGVRLNSIYCIHWAIYAFLYVGIACVAGEDYLPKWLVIPVSAGVLIAADLLSRWYKSKQRIKKPDA